MHVNQAFFQLNRRQKVEVGVGNNKGGALAVMQAARPLKRMCVKRLSAKPTCVC